MILKQKAAFVSFTGRKHEVETLIPDVDMSYTITTDVDSRVA
jgi:hypothetical protein